MESEAEDSSVSLNSFLSERINSDNQKSTHSRVGDAARERDTAALSATICHVTVEVQVLVPVVRILSTAALVLREGQNK